MTSMTRNPIAPAAAALVLAAGFALGAASPAFAQTGADCSAKFNAARTAGTLKGQSWNEFRKIQCGETEKAPVGPYNPPATLTPPPPANVVFPARIDPKYSALPIGTQRFKTCDDQFNANKAKGGNGELKWVQKGGGYFSLCTARLKGG